MTWFYYPTAFCHYFYQIFFFTIITLCIINIFLTLYNEFKTKNFFAFERQTFASGLTIWSQKTSFDSYGIMDLILDVLIIISQPKKYILPNILKIPLAIVLFKVLYPIPLLFFLFFQWYLLHFIIAILKAYIKGEDLVLSISDWDLPQSESIWELFTLLSFLPKKWAFIVLYYTLMLQKKISWADIDRISFHLIFLKPFWFLKLILFWVDWFAKLPYLEVWKRKSILAWPTITLDLFKSELTNSLIKNYFTTHPLISSKRILVSKKGITLNPPTQEMLIFLQEHGIEALNEFFHPSLVYFRGQPHQLFSQNLMPEHGFIMTTSPSIIVEKKIIRSSILNQATPWQKFIYSGITGDSLHPTKVYLKTFINRHNFWDFNEFSGFKLRLGLLYRIHKERELFVQSDKYPYYAQLSHLHTLNLLYPTHLNINNRNLLQAHINNLQKQNIELDRLAERELEIEQLSNQELLAGMDAAIDLLPNPGRMSRRGLYYRAITESQNSHRSMILTSRNWVD